MNSGALKEIKKKKKASPAGWSVLSCREVVFMAEAGKVIQILAITDL